MTQREAQFFVQGVQFGLAISDEYDESAAELDISRKIVDALHVNMAEMMLLTQEIHDSLDAGGFRGERGRRRVKQ